MGRVLAVANQKGGVAKTTTTHSLGAGLAELGERVLLVDLDPQACLTYSLGIDSDSLGESLHDVLAGRAEAADVLVKSGDLSALPSTIDLAGAEVHLMTRTGREHVLARALKPLADEYDTRWLIGDFAAGDMLVHSAHIIHASLDNVDPCGRLRLSTDIRYQRRDQPIDWRWQENWHDQDGL